VVPAQPLIEAQILRARREGEVYRALVVAGVAPAAHRALIASYTEPGQYVLATPAGLDESGPFALASAPGADPGGIELLVKPEGDIAVALAGLGPGQRLSLSAPMGPGFGLERARARDLLILAAGSGIGPIRAALGWLRRRRDDYGWIRLYSGQPLATHVAYREWLEARSADGMETTFVTSREGAKQRVHQAADSADNFGAPERLAILACGMPAMERDVRELAARHGVLEECIFTNT